MNRVTESTSQRRAGVSWKGKWGVVLGSAASLQFTACLTPPQLSVGAAASGAFGRVAPKRASATAVAGELDAWTAAREMGFGVNIGNTLENTTTWETGWGNPLITQDYVNNLAALGFNTVRLPVAWDTYAVDGVIQPEKLQRVAEVVGWVLAAGMYCVVNIHWDGGWIDSSNKERYAATYATFSPEAERKFRAYWGQIAKYFAQHDGRLVFEALNEETHFEGEGSPENAYATLQRVNQLFIDTVRSTGGMNAKRLLLITGYSTDIAKTTNGMYRLPQDSVPRRLLLSVHYYTPWTFAGLTEDADWGKMQLTWGSPAEVAELSRLFDQLGDYCKQRDIPAFIGEFNVVATKERASRVRWLTAVAQASLSRHMVPVLWETGGEISRHAPYTPSAELSEVLESVQAADRP